MSTIYNYMAGNAYYSKRIMVNQEYILAQLADQNRFIQLLSRT